MFKVAPLSGGFMITSMMGFLVSSIYVFPRSRSWGFTFAIFFTIMFVASLISMTYAPIEAEWALEKVERRSEMIEADAKKKKPKRKKK